MTSLAAYPSLPSLSRSGVNIADRFLSFLLFVLLGYAVDGRGFAYLGVSPIFVGEIALLFGIAAFFTSPRWHEVFHTPQVLALLALMSWGFVRTVPFISHYGIDALRDATLWGYGIFAIIVSSLLIAKPSRFASMLTTYKKFPPIFLLAIPIVFVIFRFTTPPMWPGTEVFMVQLKEGDVLVHLAGTLAFWIAGLAGVVGGWWIAILTLTAAVMGIIDRGGMLAFLATLCTCLAFGPRGKVPGRIIGTIVCCLVALWVSDIRVELPGGKGRLVSFDQVVTNMQSTFGDSKDSNLDGTKTWRMDWWNQIIDYTFHGPYFWTGKGFGINLADDDGFQVFADGSLRTPHNAQMTILARAGVPGLALWALVHLTWGFSVFQAFVMSTRAKRKPWPGVFLFLLGYWMAFLINGAFDVYLEGPMGGIWLWTVYGVGVAAVWIYHHDPEVLTSPTLAK